MKLPFSATYQAWKDLGKFQALDSQARSIVFYAENASSWVHFEGMISELVSGMGQQVCYLTSSAADPVLKCRDGIMPFYIGDGAARTLTQPSLVSRDKIG